MCERFADRNTFRYIIKQTVQLQLHKQVETSKSIGSSPTETQSVALKLTLKLSYVENNQENFLFFATSSQSPGTINALLRHFSYWPICVNNMT